MENKIRYTLSKKDKLKSRKAIEQVFKEGKSFSLFPFRVLYLQAPALYLEAPASSKIYLQAPASSKLYLEAPASSKMYLESSSNPKETYHKTPTSASLQTAFSVSKKYFKKAVDRNRIKRLIREAWRLQKNDLQHQIAASGKNMLVFIIFTGNQLPEYNTIFEKTTAVIKRLTKINNEITPTNT